jgi:hypothetical protein
MATAPRHMLLGGSLLTTYQILTDYFKHHDEANMRPFFVDHMIVMMIMGTFTGFMALNSIKGAAVGWMVSTVFLGPATFWMGKVGLGYYDYNKPCNIFYENDTTPEEVERIRMIDEVEKLGHNMSLQPGYGLIHKGRSAHGYGF